MPRWVSRIGAGMAKITVEIRPGHHAEAEEDEGRDQIDEGRDRLHQVEDRPDGGVEPWPVRRGDADRHADDDAEEGRRDDQRQRLDGRLPVAEIDDEQEPEDDRDGEADRTVEEPGADAEYRDQHQRRKPKERLGQAVDDRAEDEGDEIEEAGGMLVEHVDHRLEPRPERDLVRGEPVIHGVSCSR